MRTPSRLLPNPHPIMAGRPRRARALLAACSVACLFALRCDGIGGSGGPDPTPDPGCPGTHGELGVLVFDFEELGWQDLSADGGTAFATGTSLDFGVRAVDDDAVLPALHAWSEDPTIVNASTDSSDPEARYPHQLSFEQSGTTSIQLLDAADELVDRLTIRVEDPSAMLLWAAPLLGEPMWTDAYSEEPERVVVAPRGGVRLAFALADEDEDLMPGRWTPATELTGDDALVALPEGRLSVGSDSWVPLQLMTLLAIADGSVEETLTLTGPTGIERQVIVSVDATPLIERLDVILPLSGDDSEVEGTEGVVTAMGWTAGDDPAFGYTVRFFSSDPRVAAVTPRADAPDAATVRFLTPGEVVLTAVLVQDPSIFGNVTVRVTASE